MHRSEKQLKLFLKLIASLFALAGAVGLFLRMSQLRELALWLGVENAPDYYIRFVDYGYRFMCFMIFGYGLVLFSVSSAPLRNVEQVRTHIRLWSLAGLTAIVVGNYISMPQHLWLTHALAFWITAGASLVLLQRSISYSEGSL